MTQTRAEKRLMNRSGFSNNHTLQNLNGPRWSRRNILLPNGESMKGKTRKLRNKYRKVGNIKTLVSSK